MSNLMHFLEEMVNFWLQKRRAEKKRIYEHLI